MYNFFWIVFVVWILWLVFLRSRVEMFAVFQQESLMSSLQSYREDIDIHGILDINNSVVTLLTKSNPDQRYFIEKVWFDDNGNLLDYARISEVFVVREGLSKGLSPQRFSQLYSNLKKHFENRRVMGIVRFAVDGAMTVVIQEPNNQPENKARKNKVYEVSFEKDSLHIVSDHFLNIEYIKDTNISEQFPNYVYDIQQYFILVNHVNDHFSKRGQFPHGTIRLTKDILTVIVADYQTYASVVYDVHYNNQTMDILKVTPSDMTFALQSQSDMHTLIKKSPIL